LLAAKADRLKDAYPLYRLDDAAIDWHFSEA